MRIKIKRIPALWRCLTRQHPQLLLLLKRASLSLAFSLILLFPAIMTSGNVRANERALFAESLHRDSLIAVADSLRADSLQAVSDSISAEKARRTLAERLLAEARTHLGARYASGRSGPNAFDCSGFTRYVFAQIGVALSHSSRTQYMEGIQVISTKELWPGDLVFFSGRAGGGRVGHVGIVTEVDARNGTFRFIHASISSGVREDRSTDPYYARRYMGARRIKELQ